MPSHPTDKTLQLSPFDLKLSSALTKYAEQVDLSPDEIVYRAILCYWVGQKTPEAWDAVVASGFYGDEDEQARMDTGEFDEPGVQS